ncbi:Uma2 family endonuclease [Dyadobacter helix]|uniref:Uma2 family endonuclease n=1 Tax=Dyadobacter helix TaxID=2822344 RepID=UPI001BFC6D0E|nr:Uma2 family endonuclease [Dyadobacter sp. CECT 9275]
MRNLLDDLEKIWHEEQIKRHTFWATVDENRKAEFILGEIVYHSPVYGRHWMASSNILARLLPYVKDNDLGKVGVEKVMIRLTRNDYEPDICFWAKEQTVTFWQIQSAFPPPDFILEILSESTKERDYGIKMTDYALHGIKEYWIVDPENKTVEQYLLDQQQFQLAQKLKEGMLGSEIIPGFEISVRDIFEE